MEAYNDFIVITGRVTWAHAAGEAEPTLGEMSRCLGRVSLLATRAVDDAATAYSQAARKFKSGGVGREQIDKLEEAFVNRARSELKLDSKPVRWLP